MPVIINEREVEIDPHQPERLPTPEQDVPGTLSVVRDLHQRVTPPPAVPRYGVHPAVVLNVVDPHLQGRVEVSLPWTVEPGGNPYQAWARLATMAAGDNRGSWFIPDVGDEVLVTFEGGDPSRPYVIGSLWNGKDSPPVRMDSSGNNQVKMLRTRSGLQISLDDTAGAEQLELSTPGGQKLHLKDSPDGVEISAGGSKIIIRGSQIEIESSGKLVVEASTAELTAGMLTVNAAIAKFSGVVQADTLIANSVVAAQYTPGAGNIW